MFSNLGAPSFKMAAWIFVIALIAVAVASRVPAVRTRVTGAAA